jgi:hypothetical protein
VLAASIIALMTTLRYNPENSHLHTGRRENLKSHQIYAELVYLAGKRWQAQNRYW